MKRTILALLLITTLFVSFACERRGFGFERERASANRRDTPGRDLCVLLRLSSLRRRVQHCCRAKLWSSSDRRHRVG